MFLCRLKIRFLPILSFLRIFLCKMYNVVPSSFLKRETFSVLSISCLSFSHACHALHITFQFYSHILLRSVLLAENYFWSKLFLVSHHDVRSLCHTKICVEKIFFIFVSWKLSHCWDLIGLKVGHFAMIFRANAEEKKNSWFFCCCYCWYFALIRNMFPPSTKSRHIRFITITVNWIVCKHDIFLHFNVISMRTWQLNSISF